MAEKVELGKRYRHKLHGIEGVVTARVEYLTGCAQGRLERVKDGEIKSLWADEPMLEKVGDEKVADVPPEKENRGGPRVTPPSREPGVR